MFTGKFNISLSQIDKGRHCLPLELIIIVLEKLAGPIGQLRSHLIHTFIKTENRLCGAICLGRKLSGCHLLNPFLLQDRKSGLDNRIFGYRFFSCHVIHPFFCITYVIILQYYPHAVNEKMRFPVIFGPGHRDNYGQPALQTVRLFRFSSIFIKYSVPSYIAPNPF